MEENKNNAMEKVEQAIENKSNVQSVNNYENQSDYVNDFNQQVPLEQLETSQPSFSEKAEKERLRAEKRVKMAEMKEHRKAERAKMKETKRRERAKKLAEYRERKQRHKEERAMEKAEPSHRSTNGNGGWLAAVIALGVATLVLASVLTFTFLMPSASDGMLESNYQKSFYSTIEQVDNIDLNLSKILASKDTEAMQRYLVDTAINSELAENDLQQLPLHDESKYYTTKLVNQIGDFSKYALTKLINEEGLTEQDYQTLKSLYKANLTLKNALSDMRQEMGEDFSMRSILNGGKGNTVIHGFNQLENLSVEYPELIYDGPFSDGQDNREIKGLSDNVISKEEAEEKFMKIFNSYGLEKIKSVGETTAEIECYNVQAEVNGDLLYAQISKRDGKLIMFAYSGSCRSINHSDDQAIKKAQEFLTELGINNLKPVWINFTNNVYTINFAGEQNGVIIYGDLIKVRVCAETNMVIGLEAKSYYTNHTSRNIGKVVLSESQAKERLLSDMQVETTRLALVPIGNKSEKLCYEFSGEIEGSTYYVYIDAVTGRQVEMFKVIKSTEGTLLM